MKTFHHKFKFIFAALVMMFAFNTRMNAQTTITSYASLDSLTTWLCPLPATGQLYLYGNVTGYNVATDSMQLHIFWGDGNDEIIYADLFSTSGYDYYNATASHSYTMGGTYQVMVITTGVDGNADTAYTSPVYASNSCGNVSGVAFYDANGNCVQDGGESGLPWVPVHVTDMNNNHLYTIYTDISGQYAITLPSGFTYSFELPQYAIGYATYVCPSTGTYTLAITGSPQTADFAVDCNNTAFDLMASAWGWGFVPGNFAYVESYAFANSCSPMSGTATLTYDPTHLSPAYNYPNPQSVSSGTVSWNFTNIGGTYWYNYFNGFTGFTVDTNAVVGDSVCFTLTVTPVSGDVDPTNNTYSWCAPIMASYDPNEKQVLPKGIGPAGNVKPDTEFTYTVHFQNTGNYPAANIKILDTISSNLDMTTFDIIASSHPMTPYVIGSNLVKFDFPGINLPDSTNDEPNSHGWIVYKIKAKSGLATGTEIENTAYIYFDYNEPVITNTTLNTIDISLGVNEVVSAVENELYPNPAQNNVNVIFSAPVTSQLLLIDMTGRIVMQQSLNNSAKAELNIQSLPSGVYEVVIPGMQLKNSRLQVIR